MNSFKLMAAVAAFGIFVPPAMAQTTNTMGNSMGGMGSGSMTRGSMDKGMMPETMTSQTQMNHLGMSKRNIAICHKMSHAGMMKSHQCRGMIKHGNMMKHGL